MSQFDTQNVESGRSLVYIRVSSDKQSLEKDRNEVNEYIIKENLPKNIVWFEDDGVSTKIKWRERKIFQVVEQARNGDVVITTEISRLSRTLTEVTEILGQLAEKKVVCHTIRSGWKFDGSAISHLLAAMFGFVAQIEKELLISRTKAALEMRKKNNIRLGRPLGVGASRLDQHQSQILKWLADGLSKTEVCRKLQTSVSNLNMYLNKRKIKPYRPPKGKESKQEIYSSSASTSASSSTG